MVDVIFLTLLLHVMHQSVGVLVTQEECFIYSLSLDICIHKHFEFTILNPYSVVARVSSIETTIIVR
jgi:hypothetical protein